MNFSKASALVVFSLFALCPNAHAQNDICIDGEFCFEDPCLEERLAFEQANDEYETTKAEMASIDLPALYQELEANEASIANAQSELNSFIERIEGVKQRIAVYRNFYQTYCQYYPGTYFCRLVEILDNFEQSLDRRLRNTKLQYQQTIASLKERNKYLKDKIESPQKDLDIKREALIKTETALQECIANQDNYRSFFAYLDNVVSPPDNASLHEFYIGQSFTDDGLKFEVQRLEGENDSSYKLTLENVADWNMESNFYRALYPLRVVANITAESSFREFKFDWIIRGAQVTIGINGELRTFRSAEEVDGAIIGDVQIKNTTSYDLANHISYDGGVYPVHGGTIELIPIGGAKIESVQLSSQETLFDNFRGTLSK